MNKRINPLIEALKAERKRLGLTQTEVASLLGIPQSTIGRIEAGIMNPTLESVTSIASLFGKKLLLSSAERKTDDPYNHFPRFESARFLLREVKESDLSDLLEVYSDPLSWPYFNSDNCHGDDIDRTNGDSSSRHIPLLESVPRLEAVFPFSHANRGFNQVDAFKHVDVFGARRGRTPDDHHGLAPAENLPKQRLDELAKGLLLPPRRREGFNSRPNGLHLNIDV